MAYYDSGLDYDIKKAKEVIANLPDQERKYVEVYINNLKEGLDKRVKSLKEINEALNTLKRYIY